jgi:hypothetical protein
MWGIFARVDEDHPIVYASAFAGVLIAMMIYVVQRVHFPFYHDSLYYWEITSSFYEKGHFSLANFSDGLRGYLFPFLLLVIQRQANLFGIDAKLLFAVYSALFFAVFAMYLVPWFFGEVFRWKTNIVNSIAFSLIIFFFWRGHFLYPLTDFPALAAFLTGFTLLASVNSGRKSLIWLLLAGFFVGAAINIRPVYQISFIVILIFSSIAWWKLGAGKMILSMSLFLLGCGIILFPQWVINRVHFNSNSPLVLAKYVDDANVYEVQLFWGLKTQKYETNIGENYPSAAVVYSDPLALKLPRNTLKEKNIANYLQTIRNNPMDVAISYFRHTFNGLDIFFPTPYVKNIFADHFFYSLMNYLIWFLLLYHITRPVSSKIYYANLFCVLSLLAPVALAVPGVVEIRFFLPAYILAYGVISYGFDYREWFVNVTNNKWHLLRLLFLCLIWVLVCFTLSASTIERLVMN